MPGTHNGFVLSGLSLLLTSKLIIRQHKPQTVVGFNLIENYLVMKKGFLLLAICFVNWGCASTGVVGSSTEVTSEYDRFNDRTTYETPEIRIIAPSFFDDFMNIESHSVTLKANFRCDGQSDCLPNNIVFTFSSQSKNWQYLYSRNLIMIFDGQRHDLGELERVSLVGRGNVFESLIFVMNLETFFEFVEAENIELRLGTDEVELNRSDLGIFRNMATFIKGIESYHKMEKWQK
jgi:hypothetical protein